MYNYRRLHKLWVRHL